ncbi:MAG: site-specific DNA-methyltransferase [Flavobacteriales bacterium 32-34-25]|nr:MAG: site-specific DNA-methyltransferase [Flavobacteriales bacterium 32-34-25]
MEKINSLTSANIVADNIELLKQLFPTIVKEGNIDLNELKALLGETVEEKEEYYRFTWAGKNQARLEANKPTTATLRPNKADSKDWDTTNNIFIEGDNLEVLKLLQKSYANKIKMIYIDPPYNTGKDFVYKDNYADNLGNYLNITNQTDEQGKKTSTNTESDGRYHSNWLNMMYPRLRLARNLMTDDGVIFISIDDNEVHNLRKLCDEVFGEDNYVQEIIWEKKFAPQNDAKYFSLNHEQVFCYAKSRNSFNRNLLPMTKEQISRYKNPDNDPRGMWQSDNLTVATYSESYDFPITKPNGDVINPPHGRCWRTSKEKFQELINDKRIWFGSDGNGVPRIKRFLSEVQQGMVPISLFYHEDVGHTQEASKSLKSLFDDKKLFDYPKPVELLKKLSIIGTGKDDILLDFFAGSGTLSHSTLKLNAEDEGTRKCISVQLPEPTDEKSEAFKAGYKTIAEITKERIRRAGEKIKIDFKNKEGIDKLDVGFKAFKLDSSNIQAWDGNPDNLEEQLDIFANNIKTDRTEEDILFEILLKYGLDLTVAIEEKTIAGQKVFSVGQGTLFICLSNAITPAVSEGIGTWKQELSPVRCRVIFKDTGFQSDKDKTNAMQILKRFGIEEVNSI